MPAAREELAPAPQLCAGRMPGPLSPAALWLGSRVEHRAQFTQVPCQATRGGNPHRDGRKKEVEQRTTEIAQRPAESTVASSTQPTRLCGSQESVERNTYARTNEYGDSNCEHYSSDVRRGKTDEGTLDREPCGRDCGDETNERERSGHEPRMVPEPNADRMRCLTSERC